MNVNESERTYIVRVVAADSRAPITNAKVQVELPDTSKTRGRTDNAGIFWFQWRLAPKTARVHISVQAPGFVPVDDFRNLAEDTLIELAQHNLVKTAAGGK